MTRALSAACIVPFAALWTAASCGDATGPGGCEVTYVVRQSDEAPETGIRFINATGGGLHVLVDGGRIVGIGSNMGEGACEIYGLFAERYDVHLQQCEQRGGSTECTEFFGPRITRSITVIMGEITEMRVTREFFQ